MKILFITGVFENDATGASRFAKLIHNEGNDKYTVLTEDTKGGPRVIKVNSKPTFFQSKLWQYFRVPKYREIIEKEEANFDAFIFNNAVLAYGFTTSKPCFAFVHDEKLIKVQKVFRFDFLRRKILRKLEKGVVESGVKIISNSEYITDRLIKNYKVESKNIHLLYQGISLTNKQRLYSHFDLSNQSTIKIIFIKNDYLIGGLPDLVEALKIIKERNFELTIIGSNRLKAWNLPQVENVNYYIRGQMPNDEVISQMYDHHVLCIPARYEPLGVAVMEGLAVGIPTVTTGVGGLPEVTEIGNHVWQCEANNPSSIADQIKSCIENPELRKQKSIGGKKHIHDKFDFKNVEKRLIDIINLEVI